MTKLDEKALAAVKPLPSQELLNQVLTYDRSTGKLFRNALGAEHFLDTKDERGAEWLSNAYNGNNAGKEAFTFSDPRGYRHGKVLGKRFQAHRIIWKMVHGYDPKMIDHINGDPSDNRIENLRDCSNSQNAQNYKKPPGKTSHYRGVCWVPRDRAWAARISNGRSGKISLGNYQDEMEAARAYDRAASSLHGEFATLNFPSIIRSALVDPVADEAGGQRPAAEEKTL